MWLGEIAVWSFFTLAFKTGMFKSDSKESLKSDFDDKQTLYFYHVLKNDFLITTYSLKSDLWSGWFLVVAILISISLLLGCC